MMCLDYRCGLCELAVKLVAYLTRQQSNAKGKYKTLTAADDARRTLIWWRERDQESNDWGVAAPSNTPLVDS